MLNVKQGSCEYQLLKSFGLTQPGNQTHVYRVRDILWVTQLEEEINPIIEQL